MRRSASSLIALALIAAPVVAQAQTQPTQGASGADPTGGGAGTGGTTSTGGATGPAAGTTGGTAVESQPVLPAAEETPGTGAASTSTSTTAGAAGSTARGTTRTGAAGTGITAQPTPDNLEARTTPIVELHGYLRTRLELFQNFSLGWDQVPGATQGMTMASSTETYNNAQLPWYRNPDNNSFWCVPDPGTGPLVRGGPNPAGGFTGRCNNGTQTSANMRLRLNPEIHPTEFIAIHSQIDILDNLVLGSTPEGLYVRDSFASPWAPITALSTTQLPPTFGYNSFTNSIHVRRAWAEISNQTLGQLRIGRMPAHWGMGMLLNAGNGFDSDYQSTADRVMYTARLRSLGLFGSAMYEFVSAGAVGFNNFNEIGQGQPINLGFYDDVHQGAIALGRRLEPEQARAALARNEVVINGGLWLSYRTQFLAGDSINNPRAGTMPYLNGMMGMPNYSGTTIGMERGYGERLIRRDAWVLTPDIWFELLAPNFRLEFEVTYIRGEVRNLTEAEPYTGTARPSPGPGAMNYNDTHTVSQFGGVINAEYRLLNQRLRIGLMAGYASGDPELNGLTNSNNNALNRQANNDRFLTLFGFHPDYRIDLIYWRQIQRRFSGAYFFRPSVSYNFIDEPNGDLFFGNVDIIWSRASEFVQTRGNHADIGLEIDATLQYQSNHRRPDSLDTRPAPGFYALAQYGIFLPFGALGPTDLETRSTGPLANFSLGTAQTVRVILGVQY